MDIPETPLETLAYTEAYTEPWLSSLIVITMAFSMIFLACVERLIHAFFSTIWHILFGFKADEAQYTVAAVQFVSSSLSIVNRVVSALVSTLFQCLTGLASWTLVFVTMLVITGSLYIAYEEYPVIARGFGIQWNQYVGPQVHGILIIPLDLITQILKIFLPLYNTMVWITTGILTSSFLPPLLKAPDKLLQALTASAWFTKSLVESLAVYSVNMFQECDATYNNSNATINNYLPASATTCVGDIGLRTLDLITPMSHARQAVAVVMGWIAYDVCRPVAVLVDVLIYPLTDLNFAKGVHNIINAVLWLVLQLPIVTATRCKLFQQTDGMIMCIPDFDPVFQFGMEGLRKLGQTVDNWLDILLLVIERAMYPNSNGASSAQCIASPLSALEADGDEKRVQQLLFGSNFTTVTGLTETLFAMTDGVSIIYYSTAKLSVQSQISKDAWPFAIDARIGVAAVRYAKDAQVETDAPGQAATTTGMMGCR
jgi:hypothetical protein